MSLVVQNEKIWVSQKPFDFRRGINGVCAEILESFGSNAQEGLFVFYNKRKNRLKMLTWHHNGFLLMYKRLERGRFPFQFSEGGGRVLVNDKQLQGLLLGIDWQSITRWEGVHFESYC
jgi:transposase